MLTDTGLAIEEPHFHFMNAGFADGLSVSYQGETRTIPASMIVEYMKDNNEYFKTFTKDASFEWLQRHGHATLTKAPIN
jgi:hypothetical protein